MKQVNPDIKCPSISCSEKKLNTRKNNDTFIWPIHQYTPRSCNSWHKKECKLKTKHSESIQMSEFSSFYSVCYMAVGWMTSFPFPRNCRHWKDAFESFLESLWKFFCSMVLYTIICKIKSLFEHFLESVGQLVTEVLFWPKYHLVNYQFS